ncbi:LIM domain-binding protein 3 isoform X1 [Thrips palmi]|uniref:LIM domain-binding protein 3 isoform X1 n=2 Tax=Thrips palmi TaxID=161013 RepID=A0A6P8YS07_THRPL|nr:LIM domain-binding protein 3 isoform X1 [Thrips palmi]
MPRRVSESSFSGSEPTSPTRKSSKVDIRWPTFTPLHPAHKSTLFRLEDVMSVDVEDDVFLPTPQKIIPKRSSSKSPLTEEKHPRLEETTSIADVTHGNFQNLEYKQLTDFLSFLDEHIHEDDCMNLWNSVQSSDPLAARRSDKCNDSVENPSRQYLELQDFLKRQYVDEENSSEALENVARSRDSPVDSAAEIQKLVAPTLSADSNDSKKEYMELLNFLFLLRAQEETPEEPLLQEYFERKRQEEFLVSPKCDLNSQPSNKFKEYELLQQYLNSLPETEYPASNDVQYVDLEDAPMDSAAEIQKLVAPTLSSDTNDSKRDYMELLNFLFLLRAQEETPEEPLLQEYFERKRQEEFLTAPSNNVNNQPANKFKEYEQLMQFLKSLPPDRTCLSTETINVPSNASPSATKSGSKLSPKPDSQAEDETTVCSELPLRSPTHSELVTVSTEPQRLQMPVRSQSFEAATPELTESAIKAALEASASRGEEGEDAEVAAITAQASQRQSKDESSTDVAPTNGHPSRSGSATPIAAQVSSPGAQRTTAPVQEQKESSAGPSQPSQPAQQPEAFWLIFSGEYTKAMSKDWHAGHFCCWQCDESLTGQRYVLRDEHPYCIKCYESVFANACEECSKTIGIDSKDLSYKDKHWHEACFLCSKCRVSLVDKQFGSKADHIYCGNCYDAQFASRCDGCGEIFRAGTKKMEYKTRQWHEKCFCCVVCKTAIGTKSFIPREQEIYCATCYEEKFATRCVKCNKIITSGGVTYKNEPWHRECFTCTNCNTSLAGQRFTSRDEKPYCADCFGELFAKRCTACVKPITGIGGTRFISFEDRHWHNDCFICASCKTSLVGRGFITDADDIICPECAKQKLM